MSEPPLQSCLCMESDAMTHAGPAVFTGALKVSHCTRRC